MIAIKEAMKLRQRAAYLAAKERRKAAVAEHDRKQRSGGLRCVWRGTRR
jgi:hypothetical protein